MSGSKSSPPAVLSAADSASEYTDVPLTMTVHDLPTPGAAVMPRQVSGRLKMIAVLLVCAAPVIASYFTFYVVRPQAQSNYGVLVDPQVALPDVQVTALDGAVGSLPALKAQWLLVSVASGACDAACEKHVYLQRQLRESLGRDKDRLDRVWLISDAAPVQTALAQQVSSLSQGAYALRMPQAAIAQWLKPEAGKQLGDHLYLVDPLGNWMMRFPADVNAAKAKRDIERMLRAANSWDRPGRDQEIPRKVEQP
jgi:hypothetical protein